MNHHNLCANLLILYTSICETQHTLISRPLGCVCLEYKLIYEFPCPTNFVILSLFFTLIVIHIFLQTISHDTVVAAKKKAVCTMCELLIHKPEAEKVLLNNLVNKLGDPDSKVASLTALSLTKLGKGRYLELCVSN